MLSGEHRYGCGMSIMRREVLHGRLWMEHPVKVVADDGDHLAVLLEPGSPFTFHGHPQNPHPWAAQAPRQGRMTPEQISEVLTAAETVAEAIREDRRWWADWDNWQPTD